jgi:cytochrome P450
LRRGLPAGIRSLTGSLCGETRSNFSRGSRATTATWRDSASGPSSYLINDPELIRSVLVTRAEAYHKGRGLERAKRLLGEGLLTSEDSIHLRQRRLMQPAFHRERISRYGDTMVCYAERAAERWKPGETIDVHREMVGLTLAIVGKTLFDADVEGEADEIGGALTEAMELFNRLFTVPFGELSRSSPFPPRVA